MDREQLTHMMEPPPSSAFSTHRRVLSRQLHTDRLFAVLNAQNHLRLSADKRKRVSGVRLWGVIPLPDDRTLGSNTEPTPRRHAKCRVAVSEEQAA